MRGRALLTLVLAVAVPLLSAAAQQQPARPAQPRPAPVAPSFKVGIVDIGAVLRGSVAAQGLQRQLQAEQEKYQGSADQQQRDLQSEEEALERQRQSLPAETYTQKRQEFQEKVNRTTAEFRLRRRQIDEAFNNASGEINRTLSRVIEELARDRGVELVVRREAVVYLEGGDDLTAAALERLNRLLPEVTVQLPASQQ